VSEEIEDLGVTSIFLVILYLSCSILIITILVKIVRCLL
jgi:hypothetical protein